MEHSSWSHIKHQLVWLVATHKTRIRQAFSTSEDAPAERPDQDLDPSLELSRLQRYFGLTAHVNSGGGQALFVEARSTCSRVLSLVQSDAESLPPGYEAFREAEAAKPGGALS